MSFSSLEAHTANSRDDIKMEHTVVVNVFTVLYIVGKM